MSLNTLAVTRLASFMFGLLMIALVLPAHADHAIEHQTDTFRQQSPSPTSQTRSAPEQGIIASFYRGSLFSSAFSTGDDSNESSHDLWPIATANAHRGYSAALLFEWNRTYSETSYRLSGWKETNALYVALNSQFSLHFS